jgi:hypothetical protein
MRHLEVGDDAAGLWSDTLASSVAGLEKPCTSKPAACSSRTTAARYEVSSSTT